MMKEDTTIDEKDNGGKVKIKTLVQRCPYFGMHIF